MTEKLKTLLASLKANNIETQFVHQKGLVQTVVVNCGDEERRSILRLLFDNCGLRIVLSVTYEHTDRFVLLE